MADFLGLLSENKNLNFVDRILNPENYGLLRESVSPQKDQFATHKMAAEYLGEDNTLPAAFPTIVQIGDKLIQLPINQAMQYALETGEYITFPSIKKADSFSKNYKTKKFKEYYQNLHKGLLQ
tara:strand:+ start:1066 stop:1434 length:369 start_codon:yes stop_codon:yes gene_type:complete